MACELFGYSCEGVGAIASAIIATCAFFTATWQACATHKHNRLSVRPLLNTWTDHSQNSYKVQLSNIGIGPALIKRFSIYVDDKELDGIGTEPISKAVRILFPQNTPHILYSSHLSKGGVLAVNQTIDLVVLQFDQRTSPAPELLEQLGKRVKLLVEYTSIYQNKTFIYDSIKNHQDD
ncbi:hypothetical protein [Ferribacterium limneticum]|uniref:hypothetical protein n=1 Tax=Ferribacterium limneticum TaxID=76259 RepID=UPI001CFB9C46|nr:hypothetical protein [Ferribacterium limneticum]UCV29897.1 hypothetical protein KI617_07375 [Ferribacterium limneticum]UCV33816.1 hypothetical protein KI608_07375 [Ferribacterium limneticum]